MVALTSNMVPRLNPPCSSCIYACVMAARWWECTGGIERMGILLNYMLDEKHVRMYLIIAHRNCLQNISMQMMLYLKPPQDQVQIKQCKNFEILQLILTMQDC